jgi:hypothetical protein
MLHPTCDDDRTRLRRRSRRGDQARHRAGRLGVVIQSLINVALAEERRFNREVMAEALAEVNDNLERAVRR